MIGTCQKDTGGGLKGAPTSQIQDSLTIKMNNVSSLNKATHVYIMIVSKILKCRRGNVAPYGIMTTHKCRGIII